MKEEILVKKFEASVLKELKQLYSFDKTIKVKVTEKFFKGITRKYIHGMITVYAHIFFIDELRHNELLFEVIQYINTSNNKIVFNIIKEV